MPGGQFQSSVPLCGMFTIHIAYGGFLVVCKVLGRVFEPFFCVFSTEKRGSRIEVASRKLLKGQIGHRYRIETLNALVANNKGNADQIQVPKGILYRRILWVGRWSAKQKLELVEHSDKTATVHCQ